MIRNVNVLFLELRLCLSVCMSVLNTGTLQYLRSKFWNQIMEAFQCVSSFSKLFWSFVRVLNFHIQLDTSLKKKACWEFNGDHLSL